MSYLYDNLKGALGGDKLTSSKSTVIRDWTPNNIRTIVISRYGIMVAYHLGGFTKTKVYPLDVNEVARDLEELGRTHYGTPKLNGLLTKRSLSCLEEIYVDSAFINYPQVLDLLGYVRGLVNSVSRLRYFGYGNFSEGSLGQLSSNYKGSNPSYSIAKDRNREGYLTLEYKDVGNESWYHNYYLRPQYYQMDSDKGKLAIHFRKAEDAIVKGISEVKETESKKVRDNAILVISALDKENIGAIKRIENLYSICGARKEDRVLKILKRCILEAMKKRWSVDGLSKEDVSVVEEVVQVYYKRLGVVLDSAKGISNELLKKYLDSNIGFIDIDGILSDIVNSLIKGLLSHGYKEVVGMALIVNDGALPKNKINETVNLSKKNIENIEEYFSLISELVGIKV